MRVIETELGQPTGLEVLDRDVGPPEELVYERDVVAIAEVEHDRALVAIDRQVVGGDAIAVGWHPRASVVAARSLDLDDRRAEVGQQHRAVGSGQHPREIRHDQPVERTPRVVGVRTAGGVRSHGTVTFDVDRNGWVDAEQSTTNRRNGGGDFVEALARGLDVIKSFGPTSMELTVSEVATKTGLPRPTARRLLMTLEQLGYTRFSNGSYALTTKTLELGTACIAAQGIWDVARPHMLALVGKTGESSSMSQLDGSDIVYMARVPVAKIIAISVHIGTRFPAPATSMGHVLLSDLTATQLDATLATPSASDIIPRVVLSRAELEEVLARGPRARTGRRPTSCCRSASGRSRRRSATTPAGPRPP